MRWEDNGDGQDGGVRLVTDRLTAAVARLTERHPRARRRILGRFDPRRPDGLALTALVAMTVGSAWLVVGLTREVLDHAGIAAGDPRATSWIVGHRVGGLTAIVRAATYLGSNWVLLPVLAAGCVIFARRRHSWRPVVDISSVYLPAVILYSMIKNAVRRPRPAVEHWLAPAAGWSFPSGHATQAAAAWGILAVLAWSGRPVRTKIVIGAGSMVIMMLVGVSRWYLGVHWLTDVLAGTTLGIGVLSLWGAVRMAMITEFGQAGEAPDQVSRTVDHDPGPPRTNRIT